MMLYAAYVTAMLLLLHCRLLLRLIRQRLRYILLMLDVSVFTSHC